MVTRETNTTAIGSGTLFLITRNDECYRIFNEDSFNNWNRISLLSCLVFSFCFITTSNIMLIHGLRKTNNTFSVTTKLFIFLSISDLATGLITCPMQILMLTLGDQSSCLLVGIQAFVNAFTPLLSMFTILTMSVLRYTSMQSPLKRANEKNVYFWLSLQGSVALSLTVWYVTTSQELATTKSLGIFLTVVTALCVLVNGASVAINVFLHFALTKKRPIRRNSTVSRSKQREATNTLLLLSVILVFCYFPNGVAFGVIGYYVMVDNPLRTTYRDYVPWAHIPMVLNAGVNSFVYIMRNRRIRSYYKDLLTGRSKTRKESIYSMNSLYNNTD